MMVMRLLDGVIDIYMPDMKYSNPQVARRYSKVINYPKINQEAVREMYRQVGDLQIGVDGLARRGLLIRHLVLPNGLAGTNEGETEEQGKVNRCFGEMHDRLLRQDFRQDDVRIAARQGDCAGKVLDKMIIGVQGRQFDEHGLSANSIVKPPALPVRIHRALPFPA